MEEDANRNDDAWFVCQLPRLESANGEASYRVALSVFGTRFDRQRPALHCACIEMPTLPEIQRLRQQLQSKAFRNKC